MFVHVLDHHFEKPFRLFLLLKFLFRTGKAKLTTEDLKAFAEVLGYKSIRSVESNFQRLIEARWVTNNRKTGYYIIKGFDTLRKQHYWKFRASILVYPEYLKDIYALCGGAIYTYLYQDVVRKQKKGKFVSNMGDTFTTFPASSPSDFHKPIAISGVHAIFPEISISKASRIKVLADKIGFIDRKTNLLPLPFDADEINQVKKILPNIVNRKGQFCLQQIDTILPHILLRKRQKLKS